jgi:hypothetical protein
MSVGGRGKSRSTAFAASLRRKGEDVCSMKVSRKASSDWGGVAV